MPRRPTKRSIGRRIRQYRELSGATQADFAREMGVFKQRIYEHERGLKEPSSLVLWKLAKKLGVSTDALLE